MDISRVLVPSADIEGVAVGGTMTPLVVGFGQCIHIRSVHEMGVNGSSLVANVAEFDHEVVRIAVRVQHQVTQNEKSRKE